MKRFIPLYRAEFHTHILIQGTNFQNKIDQSKGAKLALDTELGVVWVNFKGQLSMIPLANTALTECIGAQDVLDEAFPMPKAEQEEEVQGPIAVKRRGRPAGINPPVAESILQQMTPEELAHRAEVRARSAQANLPVNQPPQTDTLIQHARGQAMGFKNAQISNPTQPKEGASVVGKTKALSHAQLQAQLAKEKAN